MSKIKQLTIKNGKIDCPMLEKEISFAECTEKNFICNKGFNTIEGTVDCSYNSNL